MIIVGYLYMGSIHYALGKVYTDESDNMILVSKFPRITGEGLSIHTEQVSKEYFTARILSLLDSLEKQTAIPVFDVETKKFIKMVEF